ncbi:hypothetical protein LTR49_028323 [Elasticomyces elasticus]|nr:hypothetical protein LTR49_028323 [Elasticomyces elasticus]
MVANKRAAELLRNQRADSRAVSPATGRSDTSDSKASPPQDTPRAQIDFPFLNFSHPSDAKASNARKTVRSHVTKQQHQKKQKLQQVRRTKNFQGVASESDQRPPRRPHAETVLPNLPTVIDLPIHNSAGVSSDSYLSNVALEAHNLDAADIRELLRARFLSFITTDAAPYYAVMLVATSHYERSRGAKAHVIDPLQLRGMAIREINRALRDSVRATSDHLIAAVAHLACFEALCCNRNAFNTHMTGLLRIVSMRGGLPTLGLNGWLERLLLWIDANATHLLGTRLYFDKAAFPTTAVHPRPNARRFAGEAA